MKIILHPIWSVCERGQRPQNQDNIYPGIRGVPKMDQVRLFMVCDGVGGAARGDVASRLACDIIPRMLEKKESIKDPDIVEAVYLTQKAISNFIEKTPDAEGMATTLAMVLFDENGAALAHIGDSRAYHIRAGRLLFKTNDHSLVNEMVSRKILTEDQALNHPQRNVISRAISGNSKTPQVDITHLDDILPGDYFFLCSDGVLEGFSEPELLELIGNMELSDEAKLEQIKEVCRERSRDNYSAHLIRIREVLSHTRRNSRLYAFPPLLAFAISIGLGTTRVLFSQSFQVKKGNNDELRVSMDNMYSELIPKKYL